MEDGGHGRPLRPVSGRLRRQVEARAPAAAREAPVRRRCQAGTSAAATRGSAGSPGSKAQRPVVTRRPSRAILTATGATEQERDETMQTEDWAIVATIIGTGITILLAIGGIWWRLDGKIEGVRTSLDGKIDGVKTSLDGKIEDARSDSDDAHDGIVKNIDGVKEQLTGIKVDIATANGKLAILESFVKAYVETKSKDA